MAASCPINVSYYKIKPIIKKEKEGHHEENQTFAQAACWRALRGNSKARRQGRKGHTGSHSGLGANIFSSVYGTVEEVTDQAIVIQPDDEQPDKYIPIKKSDSKLEMVKEAGIVGMGGAGFPTGVKLGADLQGGYILVNAAECEPGLRHNIMQLEQQAEKTVRGVEYCMEMSNAKKAIFAIKRKNARAISAIKKAIADKPDISIHLLPDIYPMGEERAVVRECLGILLEPTQLPSAAHANVVNCETVLRVAEAIEDQKPCIYKNISVVGKVHGGSEAQVFMDMPVGISVEDMLDKVGGIDGEYGEIIMGGAFTGLPTELDAPTTKTTGAIIVTIPFLDLHGAKVGLLVCACGGGEARMRDIAKKYNAEVVSVTFCKQAIEVKPGAPRKCENPGNCPGQIAKVLEMKRAGAEYLIIGNCSDCSNTVVTCGTLKMGLKVIHQTDHVMRTIHHPLYRHLTISKTVDQDLSEF